MKKNYTTIITKKELKGCKKRLSYVGGYVPIVLESGYYFKKISPEYGIITKYDCSCGFDLEVFDDTTINKLKATAKARGIPWHISCLEN